MNIVSYGRVLSVIDHRKSQQKDDSSVYEVLVEWDKSIEKGGSNLSEGDDQYTWMPFTQIYKEVPQIVQEYFQLKKISLEQILSDEVNNRMNKKGGGHNGFKRKGPWQSDKSNQYIDRSFDYVAKETMRITDRYQFQQKPNVEARGTGVINAKKKRNRKFLESEGLGPLDSNNRSKSKSKQNQDNNSKLKQNKSNILNNFRRKDDRPPGRLQKDMIAQKMLNSVSTFGKDVAKMDESQQSFAKISEREMSTHEDSRAKGSNSFDEIQFSLDKYKTQKQIASKEKEIKENDIVEHQKGSSKKEDQDEQDYVANFYTKKDRPIHQLQKPQLERQTSPVLSNSNWLQDLQKPKSKIIEIAKQVDEEQKSEKPQSAILKVAEQKQMTIDLTNSAEKIETQKSKDFTSSCSSDVIMIDDSPQPKSNSKMPSDQKQLSSERNQIPSQPGPGVNPWLNQQKQQENDYAIRNLDPMRLFQLHNQKSKKDQVKEKEVGKDSITVQIQNQKTNLGSLIEKQKDKEKSEFKMASIVNKQSVGSIEKINQHAGKGPQYEVGFRPPKDIEKDGMLDCPEHYPNLKQKMGTPWSNIPKMIHAMRICDKTGQIMYLCSWRQDYFQYFYTPGWVLSQLLLDSEASKDRSSYQLIAEFYHHFAEEMTVNKVGNI